MQNLAAFLRTQARRRFDWASAHCLALPADWLVLNGLPDPAEPWRVEVVDEATARAALDRAGGLEALATTAMAAIVARPLPAHAVRRGDVGVVRVMGPDGPDMAGGIFAGARWAVRSPRGIWIGRADCALAWTFERPGEV